MGQPRPDTGDCPDFPVPWEENRTVPLRTIHRAPVSSGSHRALCTVFRYFAAWADSTAARVTAGTLLMIPSIFAATSLATRWGSSTVQTQAL